jgi:hypothetical protein
VAQRGARRAPLLAKEDGATTTTATWIRAHVHAVAIRRAAHSVRAPHPALEIASPSLPLRSRGTAQRAHRCREVCVLRQRPRDARDAKDVEFLRVELSLKLGLERTNRRFERQQAVQVQMRRSVVDVVERHGAQRSGARLARPCDRARHCIWIVPAQPIRIDGCIDAQRNKRRCIGRANEVEEILHAWGAIFFCFVSDTPTS